MRSTDLKLAAELAKKLAKELCGDKRLLAKILMGGFSGLGTAKEKTLFKLAEHCGVYAKANGEAHGDGDGSARQWVGEALWPVYHRCANKGHIIDQAADDALAAGLAARLPAAGPNAHDGLILLRKGLEGSLLGACLLMGAWKTARALLDLGANPNACCTGDLGPIPALYFAVRHSSPEAAAIAAEMIRKGAKPWAPALSAFAFDEQESTGTLACARGELVKWMIFHNHIDPLHATLVGKGKSVAWIASLQKELDAMRWSHADVAKLASAIELIELRSTAAPATPSLDKSRKARL